MAARACWHDPRRIRTHTCACTMPVPVQITLQVRQISPTAYGHWKHCRPDHCLTVACFVLFKVCRVLLRVPSAAAEASHKPRIYSCQTSGRCHGRSASQAANIARAAAAQHHSSQPHPSHQQQQPASHPHSAICSTRVHVGACLTANASTLSDASARQSADGSAAQVPAQQAPTFQEAVNRLTQYWADNGGCVQYMPMNSEVR